MSFPGRRWCAHLGSQRYPIPPCRIATQNLNDCVPTFQTLWILFGLSDETAAWLCWEMQSALEQVQGESGTEVDSTIRRIWPWLASEGESVCECDECPVGCSTHHPDPSRRTVVPHRQTG